LLLQCPHGVHPCFAWKCGLMRCGNAYFYMCWSISRVDFVHQLCKPPRAWLTLLRYMSLSATHQAKCVYRRQVWNRSLRQLSARQVSVQSNLSTRDISLLLKNRPAPKEPSTTGHRAALTGDLSQRPSTIGKPSSLSQPLSLSTERRLSKTFNCCGSSLNGNIAPLCFCLTRIARVGRMIASCL